MLVMAGAAALGITALSCSASGHSAPVRTTLPTSYVVVYRVAQNDVHDWEVLSMRRPFAGSGLVYDTAAAPGRGDRAVSGSISTGEALYTVETGTVRLVSGRQPGPASGDQYLAVELDDLMARKLAADTGQDRTVAGRACRVYRFAEPPSGPVLALTGGADHDDLCLDQAGLVLSERWTYHGSVVLERTATAVRTSNGDLPAGPDPEPPSTAGAAPMAPGAATVSPDPRPQSFLAPPPAPRRYQPSGPAVDFRLGDPQNPSSTVATSVVWAFAEGPRSITVEAGTGRGGELPWRTDDTVTKPAALRGLGPATSAVRSDGAEVRVDLGGGRWVRVRGTVPVSELVAYAQRLTRAAGASPGG
jgi:hypothetical protein